MNEIAYVCSECGAIVSNDWEILDNGMVLECPECGGETILNLCKREDYSKVCDWIHRLADKVK